MKSNKKIWGIGCVLCLVAGVGSHPSVAQTWRAVGPEPRWWHSAALDTTTNRMIVFGGTTAGNTAGGVLLNDVWRLIGATWISVKPSGPRPAPRLGHSAVYDAGTNRMIVFGGGLGFTSPCENDLWVLTNANGNGGTPAWIRLSPSGGAPAPRIQHGAAYDPNTNSMIVFGGQDCFSNVFGDVWVLSNANGVGGTPAWTQLSPEGGGPGPREINGGVAYDPTNNRLIVFGGSDGGAFFNDVWVLTNANGSGGTPNWMQLSPSGNLPAPRQANSTTYDPTTNRITIFGGDDSNVPVPTDAWVLSNANGLGDSPTWTQLGPFKNFAESRFFHTGVYNPSTNNLMVFGGLILDSETESLSTNDVWVLSHANGE
jgi:Galactose oxidase, central domain/Kelch motif